MQPDSIFPGELHDEHARDLDAWTADQEKLKAEEENVAEFSGPPCACGEAPCMCSDPAIGLSTKEEREIHELYEDAADIDARILNDMADLIRELKPGWDVFDPEWLKNKRASWPIVRLQGALMGIRGNIRATGRKC